MPGYDFTIISQLGVNSFDTEGLNDQAVKEKIAVILGLPSSNHVACPHGYIVLNVSWRLCCVQEAQRLIDSGESLDDLPDTWFNLSVKSHVRRLTMVH